MNTFIVILGGSLIKDGGKWRTAGFDKGDEFGPTGDRLRIVAGSHLYRDLPGSKIICSGGKGQLEKVKGAPDLAEVLSGELVELGVSKNDIIRENISGNTLAQLREIFRITNKERAEKVIIVSNEYHLPRVKAMIENIPELKKTYFSFDWQLVSAEKILIEHDPKTWKENIEKAYASEKFKERIKLEQKGVCDLEEGRYKIK